MSKDPGAVQKELRVGYGNECESAADIRAAPILILGSHRSGMSAITGLLAEAGGLAVGDVMPPTSTNPKGCFESVVIVKAHNDILEALDRDWTCPPATLDASGVQTGAIEAEIAELRAGGRTWGLKDPRLLYMLPLWAQVLPAMRFVGVIRNHEEVVRSLAAQDGVDAVEADRISRASARRLRVLRERFEFPIIDFSSSSEEILDRTETVARALGLKWEPEAASSFLDMSLAGQRSREILDNEDVDRLRAFGVADGEPELVSSARLRDSLDALVGHEEEFDRYSGPRSAARRAMLWRAIPQDVSNALEIVRNLRVATSHDPAKGRDTIECSDLWSVNRALSARRPRSQAVLLPDLTSWVDRADLSAGFQVLHEHVAPDALVVVGLSQADSETQRAMSREAITLQDVLDAARSNGFAVVSISGDARMRVVRLLAISTTTSLLRSFREEGIEVRGELTGSRARVVVEGKTPSSLSAPAGPTLSDEAVWQCRYRRLRSRRSVRLALAMSSPTRPFFRALRQIRKRVSGE